MSRYRPDGVKFEKGVNQYGGIFVTIPGDTKQYYIEKDQRWIPHVIPSILHPAVVGDMVTLTPRLARDLGISVAWVSGVRTLKSKKRGGLIKQVELLGIPCRWFGVQHFDQYKDHQIWGHITHIPKVVTCVLETTS